MTPQPPLPEAFRPQLVALDVDDTLIEHGGAVSERVVDEIARVSAGGVLVTIATGRSPSTTIPVAKAAGITGLVVCSNGGLLIDVDTETTIESCTFDPRPVLEELIEHLPDAVYAVEDVNGMFRATNTFRTGELSQSIRMVPFEHLLTEPVVRLVVRSDQHTDTGFGEIVSSLGYESVIFGVADVAWMDIGGKGINKATMLQRLCDLRGLDPARAITVGDFWNDSEMLQWAGWGVAMGSAPDAIKAMANAVTSSVPGDGVADILESIQF